MQPPRASQQGSGQTEIGTTVSSPLFETQDFELSHQQLETKNELRNQRSGTLTVCILLVAFGINVYVPWTKFNPPPWWFLFMGVGATLGMVSCWYLARNPPYQARRKYVYTIWDALIITGAFFALKVSLDPTIFALVPLPVYLMMVILSGLRYSRQVTLLTGALALLLFSTLFLPSAPPDLRPALGLQAAVITGAVTAATVRIVESLQVLHRESVWKERLQRFLPPEVVVEMTRDPSLLNPRTEQCEATVLFADLRGFSTMSEHRPPEEVVHILNLFLGEMTSAILGARGMLVHYIGDGVLGVFGAPVKLPNHALAALEAAQDMSRRLDELNRRMASATWPTLGVGVGLHTGVLVAGSIGSPQRLDYTVIGDTVNVAARVERMSRVYGVDIVCTQATHDALAGQVPLKWLDRVQVKGRGEPVSLWTVAPKASDAVKAGEA